MFREWIRLGGIAGLIGQGLLGSFASGQQIPNSMRASEQTLPSYQPRFGRPRPIIAVVGDNTATELTDYVVPYGVLTESGVAEVMALAIRPGPIQMSPSLRFQPHGSLSDFDARHAQGADYVIVPNIYEGENDLVLRGWLQRQAELGAIIVGICDGVPTVANAGLLDGRRATGHWRTMDRLQREHPEARWTRNQRYIADGNVVTTTGVSASIPISIALIEAIAGRQRAEAVAQSLGVTYWGPAHNSAEFRLTAAKFLTALRNQSMIWKHETLGIEAASGVDEIRLALIADTYGRTRRSIALSVGRVAQPVPTLRGLTLLPDLVAGDSEAPDRMLSLMPSLRPVQALDRALEDIQRAYGRGTAEFVALTMEYSWRSPQQPIER
jgi:putative intracellular protease/amidase